MTGLDNLPPEIVFQIVRWTNWLVEEDQRRAAIAREQEAHPGPFFGPPPGVLGGGPGGGMGMMGMGGEGGDGGEEDGEDGPDEQMFQPFNAFPPPPPPQVNAAGNPIPPPAGGNPAPAVGNGGGFVGPQFMQNLFGFLNPPPAPAVANGNNVNADGAPEQNQGGPQPAANGANNTNFWNIFGPPAQPGHADAAANGNGGASDEASDDGMPGLESIAQPVAPPVIASTTGPGIADPLPSVEVADDSDDEGMPGLESLPSTSSAVIQANGSAPAQQPPITADATEPGPSAAVHAHSDGELPNLVDDDSEEEVQPVQSLPASGTAQVGSASPSQVDPVAGPQPGHPVGDDEDDLAADEDEWEDTDDDSPHIEGIVEEVEDDDDEDDEDGIDEEGESVIGMPELETVEGVDPSTFTYQDGLPSDPILPLAFLNRSFLSGVRSLLYGRAIHLVDMYQASLLLRTLSSPCVLAGDEEPDADDEETRARQSIPWLVRHLALNFRRTVSLGRGGGQVILDIIKLCPRLEEFACGLDWTLTAFVPLQSTLEGCEQMKALALRSGDARRKEVVWTMSAMEPLLSKWKLLDDLQLVGLQSSPLTTLKPLAGKLYKLSLAHCDIEGDDLSYLLKGSSGVLEILELRLPSSRLDRLSLARALSAHGSTLTSIQLDVGPRWHTRNQAMPAASSAQMTPEQAASSRYLLDGLIGYMPKLVQLKLSGNLASTTLMSRLPKTIEVLAFDNNPGIDIVKLNQLLKKKKVAKHSTTGKSKSVPSCVPKITCFTLSRTGGPRYPESACRDLDAIMQQRKACLHWTYSGRDRPSGVWLGGEPGFDDVADGGFEVVGGMVDFPGGMAMPVPMPMGVPGFVPPPMDANELFEMIFPGVGPPQQGFGMPEGLF